MAKYLVVGVSMFLLAITKVMAAGELALVPLPANFETRMTLETEYPMVLDGFVKMSDTEVREFYTSKLGEPLKVVSDIGRFSLLYRLEDHPIKISVYQRKEWTEISILVEDKQTETKPE